MTSSDSSVAPAAVIAESPSVISLHEARKPQPRARRGSSHMGIDEVSSFDKRVLVTEEQKAKTRVTEEQKANSIECSVVHMYETRKAESVAQIP